uniref:Serine/threonine-protein phosphatase 4 regulatory subunit 3-like central domain-containing protein n=2 Tax=Panagrolaimus superbus TaxID=310955 RepID=A0A914YYS9_9BILA
MDPVPANDSFDSAPTPTTTTSTTTSIENEFKEPEPHAEETKTSNETNHSEATKEVESNETSITKQESNGSTNDDNPLTNINFTRNQQNRVKLYVLHEQRSWDDKGTGHVACVRSPKKFDEWYLVVRLENEDTNVLESRITESTTYQRQQGTLIVWSESESVDLALSFQEKQGCEDVYYNICKIQASDSTVEDDQGSDSGESGGWGQTISLPPCDMTHVTELENLISSSMSSNNTREVISNSLLRGDYLAKYCDMFEMAEDLEDQNTLSSMAAIAKDMFMLNSQALLNELISERYFRHFIGMLEYDNSVRKPKKHRQFLFDRAKFKEVLPITSQDLKDKISETFRLQYLHDICLPAPSIFEENLLSTLSSTIFFNRIDIVSKLMSDKQLIKQLFNELKDKTTPPQRQKDLAGFLKEFVTCAQALQPSANQGREQFFNMMMENDVYQILDPCLSSSIHLTQSICVELLSLIVDFSLGPFRQFLMKQSAPDDESLLINKMFRYLVYDRDAEFTNARNMAEIVRIILDPDAQPRNDCETFFQFFYEHCMPILIKPITDCIANGKLIRDDFYTSRQFCMILTMLIFCVKNHTQLMRSYIIKSDLLTYVCVFLKSRHHLTIIKVCRLMRRILDLRDEVYHRHIRDKRLFAPIVEAFNANGHRYNLLNSTFLDLFEYIQHDNVVSLIDYIGSEHMSELINHDYVKTFELFNRKYEKRKDDEVKRSEQQQQRSSSMPSPKHLPERLLSQFEREKRSEDDEVFFNGDDDDSIKQENGIMEDEPSSTATNSSSSPSKVNVVSPMRKSGAEMNFPSLGKRKSNDDEGVASIFGGSAKTPSINKPGKITIKIGGTSSQGSSSSSSDAPMNEEVADAPIKTILNPRYRKSSLVTYDSSDSDSDEEGDNKNNIKSKSAPASVSVSPVSQSPPKKKIKVLHYSPIY